MDVERAIEFLIQNGARLDARIEHGFERIERNEKLTTQLIGLMSQQTTHHVKLKKQFERDTKEMKQAIKTASATIDALGKRLDAFLTAFSRTNGHSKHNGKK